MVRSKFSHCEIIYVGTENENRHASHHFDIRQVQSMVVPSEDRAHVSQRLQHRGEPTGRGKEGHTTHILTSQDFS